MFIFLGIYTLSGMVVGILIIQTITLINQVNYAAVNFKIDPLLSKFPSKTKSKKSTYYFLVFLFIILLPILYFNNDYRGWQKAIYLMVRSVFVLIIWFTILGPFLLKLLNKTLLKKREFYQTDLKSILKIFPKLKAIIYYSWKDSKSFNGLNRWSQFLARSIAYSLYFDNSEE
ncbi:MAG: hypothetical protein ABI295_10900 [Xanthomarina sp.]